MTYTVHDLDVAVAKFFYEDSDEDTYSGEAGDHEWSNLQDSLYTPRFDDAATVELPGIGTVRMVDAHGGEGEGDDYHIVISVTNDDGVGRLFKRNGYHASHDGSYLEGPTEEVFAVEKTVTVYEAK